MTTGSRDSNGNEAGDVDPGEPIAQLAGFEYDVSVGLLERIRRAIGRRTTAAQVTSFALDMPVVLLKQFWVIVTQIFNSKSTERRPGDEGKAS